jgi:hypothetical protein
MSQKISFAKSKSDVVAKKDGSFVPRQKRPREDAPPSGKAGGASKAQAVGGSSSSSGDGSVSGSGDKPAKLVVNLVPHRILFAQSLPDDCSDQQLATLFQQYAGFQEVRMVPGKKGIAFVEFQDVVQAGIALQQLHGFQLTATETLHLTYGNQ